MSISINLPPPNRPRHLDSCQQQCTADTGEAILMQDNVACVVHEPLIPLRNKKQNYEHLAYKACSEGTVFRCVVGDWVYLRVAGVCVYTCADEWVVECTSMYLRMLGGWVWKQKTR